MKLEDSIPLFCDKHGWQWAVEWDADQGYKCLCDCRLKYKANQSVSVKDYDRLLKASQGHSKRSGGASK